MSDNDYSRTRAHYAVGKDAQLEEPRSSVSCLLEVLLWLAILGTLASVAVPHISGFKVKAGIGMSALVGVLLWPFLLAKVRRSPLPWLYPLAGLAAFVGIFFVGGVVRGLERHAKGNELLDALERFEPDTGAKARAVQEYPERLQSILMPAVARAVQRAPDDDVIAYRDDSHGLVETSSGLNRQRCRDYALGGGMRTKLTREEELVFARAFINVFDAAAPHRAKFPVDRERARATHERIMKKADPEDVLSDPERTARMTEDDACDFYLRLLHESRKLSVPEAANLVRANMLELSEK